MRDGVGHIEIVHVIPEDLRSAAVLLYDDAFGAKFSVAISSSERRVALLQESLNLRFAFGAVANDELVGLAGYRTDAGSLTDGITYPALLECLGVVRGNWAAFVLSLYDRSLTPHELLMDGIVVDARMRGQGIGTMLLDELAAFAGANGYNSLRLDVIDTNPNAQRMYERNGFTPAHTETFGYLRWLLGFGATTTLVRNVGDE